ncbi:hypothetical protein ACFSX9_12280 [Flavobacterium ardleyense]|uniref:DUF4595 domain-containing protein n=1 Tax=Flavobacterium ardleyense TaxID=2038737 RepID=A0ABW5Z9T5_9FLAO
MKKLLTLLVLISFSMQGIAQVKRTTTQAATVEVVAMEDDESSEDVISDTLKIKAGKKYAILISIAAYPVQVAGDNLGNEQKELKDNFKKQNLEVIMVRKHCFLKFENGEGLDMTNSERPFQSTAYWSGDVYDEVELFDKLTHTTEFVAAQMGIKKESSYAITARKTNETIGKLATSNNSTANSKVTLKKYLQMYQTPFLTESEEYWYLQEIPKVKNIKIFFTEKGKDKLYKNYDFNSAGQITLTTNFNNKGKPSDQQKFVYKDEMLTEIIKEDHSITVNYDDHKMILSENLGDANETRVYWIEKDMLLSKRYIVMTDNTYADQNSVIEDKIVDNCVVTYVDGNVTFKNCISPYGVFPFTHSYISYQFNPDNQKNEFMQLIRFKIIKNGTKSFEKQYSSAQNEKEKDNYTPDTTFHLNENNLISKITNEKNLVKIVYSYY